MKGLGKNERKVARRIRRIELKLQRIEGQDGATGRAELEIELARLKRKQKRQAVARTEPPARRRSRRLLVMSPLSTPIPRLGPPHPDYIKDDGFYKTPEWRRLRYLALKNCGGRCQCCGAKASEGAVLHVDHIKPRYKFPELSLWLDNLQVLCEDCNIGKGAWDDTDWRPAFPAAIAQ